MTFLVYMTYFGDVHNKSSIIKGSYLCCQLTHIFVSTFSGNHRNGLQNVRFG